MCAMKETWHSCTEKWGYFSSYHTNSLPLVTMLQGWLSLCGLVYSFGGKSTISDCEKIEPWSPFRGRLLGPGCNLDQGCTTQWCCKWQRAVYCQEQRLQTWPLLLRPGRILHQGTVAHCTNSLGALQMYPQGYQEKTWSWTAEAHRITVQRPIFLLNSIVAHLLLDTAYNLNKLFQCVFKYSADKNDHILLPLSFPSLLDFLKILLKSFSRASESRLKLYFEQHGMNHTQLFR